MADFLPLLNRMNVVLETVEEWNNVTWLQYWKFTAQWKSKITTNVLFTKWNIFIGYSLVWLHYKKWDHFQPKYNNKKFLWQTSETVPPKKFMLIQLYITGYYITWSMNSRNISSTTMSTCFHQTPKLSVVDYTWTQTCIKIKTFGSFISCRPH